MSHMVYSAYTRASPYPAFPHEIQIIRLTHFENSSAKDEGWALATRWRAEKCHGGIPYYVSHLLISGYCTIRINLLFP
jgi:hypothetical protein